MHRRSEKRKEIEYGIPRQERIFGISRNNKSLPCPFQPVLCQESYCPECQKYLDWQRRKKSSIVQPLFNRSY